MRPTRRAAPLLSLAPLVLAASLASVADGSVGARFAAAAPPVIESAWIRRRPLRPSSGGGLRSRQLVSLDKVMRLRGGVKRATVKADEEGDALDEDEDVGAGAGSAVTGFFKSVPPVTRVYMILVFLITTVDYFFGEAIDSGNTFALDWGRTVKGLELWRPLTSLMFLGPLSMSWATNVFFLFQHGTRLELVGGTAEQVIFLLFTGVLLMIIGPLIGMPLMSTSMIAAHTYVSSRIEPLGLAQTQFFPVPMWSMPFVQAGVAVLQAEGSLLAAIPHVVGILCGHAYHFFTVVHPLMGAKRRLGAPGWMKRRLDGGDNPNFMEVPGEPATPRGRKVGKGKNKSGSSKRKGDTKGAMGGAKKSKSKPIPEFPNAGGGCS